MTTGYVQLRRQNQTRCLIIVATIVLIVGLICLCIGIAFIVKAKKTDDCKPQTAAQTAQCEYSEEAKRVGLGDFLQKAQDKYYELNPNKIASKPGVKPDEIRKIYRTYDPSPGNIKRITDAATKIAEDLDKMPINMDKLTLREKRAVAQVSHWAKHSFIFILPYQHNYYVGGWMMGGDIFCWNPMCFVPDDFKTSLLQFKPSTVGDMEILRDKFKEIKQSFDRFVENMKLGVTAGMVRTVLECKAGLDAFKDRFRDVAVNGPAGIYAASFIKPFVAAEFISDMKNIELKDWKKKYGKSVNESLYEFILDFVGKPIDSMLRHIEGTHMQHCAPESVSTGFSSLPLSYVYVNGTQTGTLATGKLPTGKRLDGKESYRKILQHFTTTSQTPDEIYKLGEDMLNKLYSEVLDLAKKITKQSDANVAKQRFLEIINSSSQFFNDEKIPANESDANAHKLCSDKKGAEMYCPKRTAAMKKWFAHTKEILATLEYEIADLFHYTGSYKSTPSCPIKLDIDFNPASGVPFYIPSDAQCSKVAAFYTPFFLDRPGPKYESVSLVAHEARPGHHTQVQGYTENFIDSCGDPIGWVASNTIYLAFAEGWALYAENPIIPEYTKMYEVDPISKYGMLKWQVWRALRLMMDTGLHFKGKSRAWALQMFADYAWDTSDVAKKEVTRYQSLPGQAATYMLGQLSIMKLKKEVSDALKDKFNIKDFHYQVLRQGPSPLSYLNESIKKYISCVQNTDEKGCDEVMDPPTPKASGSQANPASVSSDVGISPWVM